MPEKYFVVDTNVVISIAVFASLNPAQVLKKILQLGKLAFSEPILHEYSETLSSSKFDKYISIEKWLQFLEKLSVMEPSSKSLTLSLLAETLKTTSILNLRLNAMH